MNKSVQQLMDETMCRPGYVWNDTLKKCLGVGGGGKGEPLPDIDPVEVDGIGGAPAKPVGNGRGDVRVNPNGVVQKGTSMGGKGISIK